MCFSPSPLKSVRQMVMMIIAMLKYWLGLAKEEEIQCIKNWFPEDMDFISGMGLMATMLILPFSMFSFVAQIKITMLVDCKNVSHRVTDICASSGPRGFHGSNFACGFSLPVREY